MSMQVTGDIAAYAHLSSSKTADQTTGKAQTPVPKPDSDGDADRSKSAGASKVISHNKAGGLDIYA
jgi:hypothetical protein